MTSLHSLSLTSLHSPRHTWSSRRHTHHTRHCHTISACHTWTHIATLNPSPHLATLTLHLATLGLHVATLKLTLYTSSLCHTISLSLHFATLNFSTLGISTPPSHSVSPHSLRLTTLSLPSRRCITPFLHLCYHKAPSFLNNSLIIFSIEFRSKCLLFRLNRSFLWDFKIKTRKTCFLVKILVNCQDDTVNLTTSYSRLN